MTSQTEDQLEQAYWEFDARRKGYYRWKHAPQTERDAFKSVVRSFVRRPQAGDFTSKCVSPEACNAEMICVGGCGRLR